MTHQFTTIIIADSRGRGLDDFVGQHLRPINHQYVIDIQSGKSPAQLVPIVTNTIARYDLSKTYCILFAGICGLTIKIRAEGKHQLRYPIDSRSNRVSTVLAAYSELKEKFGPHINFCTIIPASLADYYHYFYPAEPTPDYAKPEQAALEEDILHINQQHIGLNQGILTNINLANRCLVNSKKKRQRSGKKVVYRRVRKFVYTELFDGVHFTAKLRDICFRLILDTAIRDISNLFSSLESEESDTSSSSDDDDRDFKRKPSQAS